LEEDERMRTIIFVGGPLHLQTRELQDKHFISMGYLGEDEKYTSYKYTSDGPHSTEYWRCEETTNIDQAEAMVKAEELK